MLIDARRVRWHPTREPRDEPANGVRSALSGEHLMALSAEGGSGPSTGRPLVFDASSRTVGARLMLMVSVGVMVRVRVQGCQRCSRSSRRPGWGRGRAGR